MRADPPLPPVFTGTRALAAGLTRKQIEGRVASGAWHRLRRGCFCPAERWHAATPEGRHVLLAFAVYLSRSPTRIPYVFSDVTAAALWGLPVDVRLLDTVTVTVDPAHLRRTRHAADLVRRVAAVPDAHRTTRRGLPVTTLDRTLADCSRHLDALHAVAVLDAAAHRGMCTPEAVAGVLDLQQAWPYAAAARSTLLLVDGRRESPLESRSAVVMHRHGIPAPDLQVTILDARGVFVARSDFAWRERGVVGEADGRTKYLQGDARAAVSAFEAEKDRGAAVEALGLRVVRWGNEHLRGEQPVMVARLLSAFRRGDGGRFTGRFA